jgi:hypothetical protein
LLALHFVKNLPAEVGRESVEEALRRRCGGELGHGAGCVVRAGSARRRYDVRDEVVRAANATGWAVERADPAERTTDPHSFVDRASRLDDGYSPIRKESDIQVVDEADPLLWERISGERMGATLHRLGLLGEFLASGSGQVPKDEPAELDGPQKEAD